MKRLLGASIGTVLLIAACDRPQISTDTTSVAGQAADERRQPLATTPTDPPTRKQEPAATPQKQSADTARRESHPSTRTASADIITRGEYLVRFGGCNDCHTPQKFDQTLGAPMPDMTRMLSGHPANAPEPAAKPGEHDQAVIGATFTSFKLPFGTVFTANLTPHKTGLGTWNEKMFMEAMRKGRHAGDGRAILPPMPWPAVASLSDDDLRAVFAYLQSIPAIDNQVPAPKVPNEVVERFGTLNEKIVAMHEPQVRPVGEQADQPVK